MLIAVLSDIHDHLANLAAALGHAAAPGGTGPRADALVCCGDLCSPFVVDELARGFPAGPIHLVFGNNDGDRYRIAAKAGGPTAPNVAVHGESAELELGGRRVFVHHFADVGRLAVAAGRFDLVCYGHDHERALVRDGRSLGINPGAVMGWHPRRGEIRPTFALYDTETGAAEIRDAASGEAVPAEGGASPAPG